MFQQEIFENDKITVFDIQLAYSYCENNISTDPMKLLETGEEDKKQKCVERCREHNLNFTPYVAILQI